MTRSTVPANRLVAEMYASHEPFEVFADSAALLSDLATRDRSHVDDLLWIARRFASYTHIHHRAEELRLFPAIRDAMPSLAPAIDRLLEQHEELAQQIDLVHEHADALEASRCDEHLTTLVDDLERLSRKIADHLGYEESTVIPVISGWDDWPFDHPTLAELLS